MLLIRSVSCGMWCIVPSVLQLECPVPLILFSVLLNFKVGLPAQRPIIAGGIRALTYVGWKTGPCLNPMVAFSWVSLHLHTCHAMPPIRMVMVGRIKTLTAVMTLCGSIMSYSDPNEHIQNTPFPGYVRCP